jgi:nucleotide-binding universal stress UspA family protein
MTICEARSIVCATDLSDDAAEALDSAFGLPACAGPRKIHVLHVRDSVGRMESIDEVATREDADDEQLRAHVRDAVKRFTADHEAGPSCEVVTEVRYGKPVNEIVAFAMDIGADLIVVGTHGRTGLRHALIGSVAEQVVHLAPCSVLVAKTKVVRDHLAKLAAARE